MVKIIYTPPFSFLFLLLGSFIFGASASDVPLWGMAGKTAEKGVENVGVVPKEKEKKVPMLD